MVEEVWVWSLGTLFSLIPCFIMSVFMHMKWKSIPINLDEAAIADGSRSYYETVMDGWNRPLINEIYVVEGECEANDEPAIILVWMGAEHLCWR